MKRRREMGTVELFWPRMVICGALCLGAVMARSLAPEALEQARQVVLGGEAAQAAFSEFTQSVADGERVVTAFSALYATIAEGTAGDGQ